MKTLLAVFAAAGLAGAALAQPATRPSSAQPSPEHQKLAVWYGEWTYAGEIFSTPAGPASKFTGRMTGRPILGGYAGEFVFDEKRPSGGTRKLEFNFWDAAAKEYVYVSIRSDGRLDRGTFAMNGNLTTSEDTVVLAGVPHKVRHTETMAADGASYLSTVELQTGPNTWLPMSAAKYSKVVTPTVEQALIKLEEDWAKAYLAKDVNALGRIEADGWICTTWEGEVFGRAEDMTDLETGNYAATDFKVEDLKVLVYGDTAVVSGRQTEKATYKGKDASGTFRITDTWIRRDGQWQCIASHLSKIAGK